MAKQPDLSDLGGSLANETSVSNTINNNNQEIRDAFDNTISRDGSTPNTMAADFDMNGYDILNVGNVLIEDGTYGDVIISDDGNTMTVTSGSITFDKIQDIASDRLVGRDTAGSGDSEELTVGGGIEFTGSGGIQSSAYTGDVTKAAGGTALSITAGIIDNADINASAAIDATKIHDGSISNTEFGYLNGVTSAIQTQINAKQATLSGAVLTGVTVAGTDKVLIQDVSDSDNLKTVTAQSIADLATVADGDKGDIVVSGSGTVWTIDTGVIVNADINASAAIDATKIADGTVTNAEFQFIGGLTSDAQTQINAKQASDATLTALAAHNTNGLLTQTAADTFTGRAITGTANEISVSNGDGVAGAPTLSLPATIDLGGKTSLEIPNSAAPTVDADGEVAVDTTVADFSHGVMKYFGGEEMAVIAVPVAQLTSPTDGYVIKYNATADEFQLAADATGGGGLADGDYGDVTVSGSATVFTVDNDVVTFAKMQNIATDSLIGRDTAATGDPQNILLNATLEMDGSGNLQRAALTGDVTATAGSNTTAIAAGVIVNNDVNASAAIALSKLAATTASRALVSDASGFVTAATTTSTEIGYVNGVTSAIQTQINAKQATLSGASLTGVTVATDDKVLIQDTSDSNNLKTVTAQSIADLASAASGGFPLVTQDAAITLDSATHKGKTVELTGSTNRTWAFTAAATLGSSWSAILVNSGTAELTLDPDGAELIDGLATFKMYPGESRLVVCTGTAFKSYVIHPFYLTVAQAASPFTFTKPPGYRLFDVALGGSGGAGGKSNSTALGGGGGGGGAHVRRLIPASSIGTTETITIGAGASSQTTANTDGANGNSTTFGSLLTAYGGGGGDASAGGGGGGGQGGAGAVGTFDGGAGGIGLGGTAGGTAGSSSAGGVGGLTSGGGGGDSSAGAGTVGGQAYSGGGGGGGGGDGGSGGAAGGASVHGGGGGGGGSGDTSPTGGAGGTSAFGGAGGAGGADANGTSGTSGTNGFGGGGGGGCDNAFNSGAGGNGSAAVWGVC